MRIPAAEELLRGTKPDAGDESHEGTPGRLRAVPDGWTDRPADRTGPVEAPRRSSGRERHEEKITVYISSGELVDMERARLTLRASHGLAVDRGRLVREAVAAVLEDLDARGEDSTLVRRLRALE